MIEHHRLSRAAGTVARLIALGLIASSLSACGSFSRLSEVGRGPGLDNIKDPQANPDYVPVSLPMPAPQPAERNPNSLWRNGARAFFKDQRAKQVGDILTVIIKIDDKATIANQTKRDRSAAEDAGLPNLLGFELPSAAPGVPLAGLAAKNRGLYSILPEGADLGSLIKGTSKTANDGKGTIDRKEQITLKVAALVIQILPNGNLVLKGKQEVKVNQELRELTITGVIRPEDIDSANTITYDKIAEARISYGGRGVVSDLQQPRYGQQLYEILFPF
ncbi:MAG: flagellar basal body L-ring protein FlgH [Azospirillum sp.]|nr:flagellar basal body L-ring protein FlgH [Azospirillum sp.]